MSVAEAWQQLTAAAAPYRLRMENFPDALLPDLVILRPDGSEVGRMRYLEPDVGPPEMRDVYPPTTSHDEQMEVTAHLASSLGPVIARLYSPGLWIQLLKAQDAH